SGQPPTVDSRQTLGIRGVVTQNAAAVPQATSITLPNGSVCQFSGTGATLAFNGQRVNYTCGTAPDGSSLVVLGTPTFQNGTWSVQTGNVVQAPGGGFSLAASQTVTMQIARVDLIDG